MAPTPVKYFIAILRAGGVSPLSQSVIDQLQHHWGTIDYQSKDYPFDQTDYYQEEMGDNLQRCIVSFNNLRSPEELTSAKLKCIELESKLSCPPLSSADEGPMPFLPTPLRGEGLGVRGLQPPKRLFNLDIGYLDHNKIVLASVKGLGQKIYLSQGIYADLIARYGHGRYQPFEWTFPDFKEGRYDADLAHLRQRYLEQLKELRAK